MEKEGLSRELNKESRVDLSSLTVNFCSEEEIERWFESKMSAMGDKDKWIEENKEEMKKNKKQIQLSIQKGLIPDDKPESIWRSRKERLSKIHERAISVKQELEQKIDNIKEEIAKRLQKLLPPWKLKEASVNFTMCEEADFRVDGNKITVDLGRLTLKDDPIEDTVKGMTHEIFHIWMGEMKEKEKEGQESAEEIKNKAKFGVANEGLAVLIGGQSLPKHHEEKGRDYSQYIIESFENFNKILSQENVDTKEFEKQAAKEFRDMGHFYVVGYEIVNAILQKKGIDRLKEIIKDIRTNPKLLFEEYKYLCHEDDSLPKINIE